MFEQTFVAVPARTRRAWTVAVSFCGQLALAALAALVPLVFYDSLPGVHAIFRAPEAPRGVKRKAPDAVKVVDVKFIPRSGAVTAPFRIPPKVEMVNEIAAPPSLARAGDDVGVIGGTGDGAGISDITSQIVKQVAAIAAPPAAVRPAPVPVKPREPAPPPRIRVSDIQPANLLHRVLPVYPPIARQAGISGTVRLQAIIGRGGSIQELQYLSGPPLLARAAMDAVRQWVYRPVLLNGEPVEVITTIEVNFVLGRQ